MKANLILTTNYQLFAHLFCGVPTASTGFICLIPVHQVEPTIEEKQKKKGLVSNENRFFTNDSVKFPNPALFHFTRMTCETNGGSSCKGSAGLVAISINFLVISFPSAPLVNC